MPIDELNVLNNVASREDKQTCNDFIDDWRARGLLNGYFGMKCNEIYRNRRATYNDILELYIYYCFILFEDDVSPEEQKVFRHLANYYYMLGQKEVGKKPKQITDALFYTLLATPCTNGYTLDEYKGQKALNSTFQIHRQAVMQVQQGKKPNVKEMGREIEKEQTERLKVGVKISGVIDMILIGMNNEAKVEGIKEALGENTDGKVRFVAVMDDRTTKMCKSLDGQLFSIKGENTFKRYSDSAQGVQEYVCDGLIKGLNLPPITDHFHWCRSTIIYNPDMPKSQWYDNYVEMKTRNQES